MCERVVVARDQLLITLAQSSAAAGMDNAMPEIRIPWQTKIRDSTAKVESDGETAAHNEGLIHLVVRSQAWIQSLRAGAYESIEMLAEANGLHPKVVRQALRLAFLSPDVTSAILEGRQPASLSLAQIPKLLPFSWTEHLRLLE
jgi:site-specific DNA recombinase